MRILVDENIPQGPEVFSAHGRVETFHGRRITPADVREADALLVRSITKVNRALLEGSRVRFVGTATIGVDHVDTAYLRERGIGFSAAPGCNARSVAEYFVAALLHLRIEHGVELEGKTLGVVGYGNVGSRVAAIAPALGLKVLVSDPPLQDSGAPAPAEPGAGHFLPLEEIARRADILTFHTPLTKTGPHPTWRMAGRDFFASLDRPVTLLNMGRGDAFDGAALLEALDAGQVAHLVLDVFPGEPHLDPALARRARLITPHIAGYSIQGKLNGTEQILNAFCAHFGRKKGEGVRFPVPEEPEIALGELLPRSGPEDSGRAWTSRKVEEAAAACVRRAYDVLQDDADLRRFLDDPQLALRFDALRKTYPVRHEFPGYTVTEIPPEGGVLREKLRELGFRTVP